MTYPRSTRKTIKKNEERKKGEGKGRGGEGKIIRDNKILLRRILWCVNQSVLTAPTAGVPELPSAAFAQEMPLPGQPICNDRSMWNYKGLVTLTQHRKEFTVKGWSRISLGLNHNLNFPSVQSCFLPFLFTDVDPKSTQLMSCKLNSTSGFPWKPICNNNQEPHCRSVKHTRIKIPMIVSIYTFL